MSETVESWFETLEADQEKVLRRLRQLILSSSTAIEENIKWSRPCYSINHLFCYLHKSANHVTIGFQKGAHLQDPESLLEGEGLDMRHIKIDCSKSINESAIRSLIEKAIEFDQG